MNGEANELYERVTHRADEEEALRGMTDREVAVLARQLKKQGILTGIPGRVLGMCYVECAERFMKNEGGVA